MSCKPDGMCRSAAACFVNGGCIYDEPTNPVESDPKSDDRYREGYENGWRDAKNHIPVAIAPDSAGAVKK